MKSLEGIIARIAGENGWYNEGQDKFIEIGEKLLDKGFSLDEVEEMLKELYDAVAAEFQD